MHGGTSWIAGFGAITGGLALLLTFWRFVREAARLHVHFYVYPSVIHQRARLVAEIKITNVGTLPAFITDVTLIGHPAWHRRWPLIRAVSFRNRSRWPLRRALDWSPNGLLQWARTGAPKHLPRFVLLALDQSEPDRRARTEPALLGRLEPGDARRGHLVEIINGQPEFLDTVDVERILHPRQFVAVDSGLRQYTTRVVDNRPSSRRASRPPAH